MPRAVSAFAISSGDNLPAWMRVVQARTTASGEPLMRQLLQSGLLATVWVRGGGGGERVVRNTAAAITTTTGTAAHSSHALRQDELAKSTGWNALVASACGD